MGRAVGAAAQFADEDDPPPPHTVAPPDCRLATDFDPDELLGIVHAYAGQVAVLDACLGAFLDELAQSRVAAATQLNLLSARGFPLGEHLRVGGCGDALYNELLQTAWLMRWPEGEGRMVRSQALVRPADLPGTLLDVLELDRRALAAGRATSLLPIVRGEAEALRDHVTMVGAGECAVRTPAWHLRHVDGGPVELYAKPSDRWEVNEVSKLCPEAAAGLDELAVREADGLAEDAPLAELLVTEFD